MDHITAVPQQEEDTLPQFHPVTRQSPPKPAHTGTPSVTAVSHHRSCPGALSLHEYRKQLSQSDLPSPDASGGRRVRRKSGTVNLNSSQSQYQYPSSGSCPGDSVSSAASRTPSLSPSYSFSAMSQSQGSDGNGSGILGEKLSSGKNMGISPGQVEDLPPEAIPRPRYNKACSDSLLEQKQQTTIFYEGASFQILNPRDSLRFARVVSYIEDMDCSRDEAGPDSWLAGTGRITEEDESIYNKPHGLSNSHGLSAEDGQINAAEEEQQAHLDTVGSTLCAQIPSFSERLGNKPGPGSPPAHYGGQGPVREAEPLGCPIAEPAYESEGEQAVSPLSGRDISSTPAFFYPIPNPSPYPFTRISAGHMESIYSFHLQDQFESMPSVVQERTGRKKLMKPRPMPVTSQKEKGSERYSILRPLRRLREAAKVF